MSKLDKFAEWLVNARYIIWWRVWVIQTPGGWEIRIPLYPYSITRVR